ncbi:MAG: hypothetical protein ACRDNZ_16685 [Streptosporangiaceae bacterium]
MPGKPNALLADVMRRAGFSHSGLGAHVRRVAAEHGAVLRCTHVDVRRWLDDVAPRPATAGFAAVAPSRKGGFPVSPHDIGMSGWATRSRVARWRSCWGGPSMTTAVTSWLSGTCWAGCGWRRRPGIG